MLMQTTQSGFRLSFTNPIMDTVREQAEDMTYNIVMGILDGIRDLLVDLAFSIVLVGGGLAIILKVAGWEKGYRWVGILTVAYVLIKYLLG